MKNVYAITVKEVLERTVCVEAEDLDEAIDKVESAYRNEDIVLEAEDFYGDTEFIPSCYAGENGVVPKKDLEFYKEHYQWIKE